VTRSAAAIHPELQRVARRGRAVNVRLNRFSLALIRFATRWMRAAKRFEGVTAEDRYAASHDGWRRVRLRVYRPDAAAASTPVLLWLHGGGYVIGKPEIDDAVCAQYAREVGIAVVSVDYPLAPDHAFPTALEDCYAALLWAANESTFDAERIAIGGASAGGGLAAALVQLAVDRGAVRPRLQLLVYPMLDDRTALRTDLDDTNNVTWSQHNNRFGWESYLGRACGADDVPAYAVPARRADLSALPPAWIGVGTLDLFHPEDTAYADRLRACGVECELEIVPGAFHGFDVFDAELPVVRSFRAAQIAALRAHLVTSS
jgi:acetyl esterase/lipase